MAACLGSIAPAGDLVKRVDGEGRGAVGRRQQVGVHAQGGSGGDHGVLVHAVRPDDLLGGGHGARQVRVGPLHARLGGHGVGELAAPDCDDAAGPPDLVLLGRQRHGIVGLPLRLVRQAPGRRVEAELVAVARVRHGLGALRHVEAKIQRVAAEDVAHAEAAHHDELEARLPGHALQAGGAHLARGSDREAVAGDEERLTPVHALAEVRHEVAERPGLPPLVQRLEALGHAVGGRRDLIRVDGVELLLLSRHLQVPEDQRPAAHESRRSRRRRDVPGRRAGKHDARRSPGRTDPMHPVQY